MERNEKLKEKAQNLRRKMTKEEAHLWYQFLCRYPLRFRRQYVIGNYITDFTVTRQNWWWSWMVLSILPPRKWNMIKNGRITWSLWA